MLEAARERLGPRCRGRHVVAIQDTTDLKAEAGGTGLFLHPVIAVDADTGSLLGLVDAKLLNRAGGARGLRARKAHGAKESRRWLDGQTAAAGLIASGAAKVSVVADRESDIYEDFAYRPRGVDVVIRAGQDRALVGGGRLFSCLDGAGEAARVTVDLPAAPGRAARAAVIAIRHRAVSIARPASRKSSPGYASLPRSVDLALVEAREIDPPDGQPGACWRLLTSHRVENAADAVEIVRLYRRRWLIEQVFRTMKTKGFDVGAVRLARGGPYENLAIAILIAAISVLQLVQERDGAAGRPLGDSFDAEDAVILDDVSRALEGKTARQKNPHPPGSLAHAAWVLARLGGWTGYYGKPGPIVILEGLVQYQAIKQGWKLRDV